MSRYSPQQTRRPDDDFLAAAIANIGPAFFAAQDQARERRRQASADQRIEDLFNLQFHERGGRYGDAGAAEDQQRGDELDALSALPLPDVRQTPSRPPMGGGPPGLDREGLGEMFAGAQPDAPDDLTESLAAVASMGRPPRPARPGAYVKGQGFAGISRPRFEQIRPHLGDRVDERGMYIDTEATPAAERARDRESQLALTSALRQDEIRARGSEARDLEDIRQKGRLALRDRINAGQITGILTRGDVQATNQRAHDTRTATMRKDVASRPATEGQRENNATKAADGVIAAANGSYDAAVDWLDNTPEGKDAAAHGLQRRHLYAALGKYEKGTTDAALRLQAGLGGDTPEGATSSVSRTREIVTGARKPAPAAGAPPLDTGARETWAKANPPKAGETREQYKARYEASRTTGKP